LRRCLHASIASQDDHYQRIVYNHTVLHGPWAGWRMAGRDLVSPDGLRIAPHRLRGFLYMESIRPKNPNPPPPTPLR
jgi:hypothetical protein